MHQNEMSIIYLAKENDNEAIEILIKRYRSIIFVVIREYNFYLRGMEIDDFIQEGNLGILKAIKYFNPNKNVKFSSFVRLCVKSEIISFVKKYSGKKHELLTNMIYSRKFSDRDIDYELMVEEVYSSDRDNPERIYIFKELCEELRRKFKKELSLFEQEVLNLLLIGYSYREICIELKKEPKKLIIQFKESVRN
ncbi:sigma-70 family RNA polymerase sigma factor [Cetobacterium somerae]|uniref:sigma-70 family RNA polymerase sigma factor n=1 Tax=Cetobacterium somerae TaxID=188913 RepID=UPI00389150A3